MSPPFNVLTATAAELQQSLTIGTLTSVQIVETYLAQIEKHNHAGAHLNAVISVAPRELALKQAAKLDQERQEGKTRSPFHGLPIIVKDCFQIGPEMGMKTTAGAYCFSLEQAKENAEVITQLLDKGIIILGTANLSEFCGHKAEEMTPGWSAMGGRTRSAYDLDSDPNVLPKPWWFAPCGGSSSGSGVGVSAGFVPMSLGTETGGSLVYPASRAGLYAMRPTLGSVSSKGVFRISKTYDGVGAMARTPYDLSLLVELILKHGSKHASESGFGKYLTKSWEGLKIGIVEVTWGMGSQEGKDKWTSDLVKRNYDGVAQKIRDNGGHVLFPASPPEPSTIKYQDLVMRDIAYQEFNEVIQIFCDGFENPKVRTAKDIVKFNEEHADKAMPEPHANQKELIASSESSLTEEQCATARSEIQRLAGKDGMEKYMTDNDLDLVVSSSDCSLISFTSCAGYPSATVPLGNLENGQPYGLFILARENREDLMFRFMSAFEATFPKIKGPNLV
ncbi:amidase-like protein [Mollisia scopiformis]|uniref:Amidase-like protein n=1 Tax=Mollisia scopiformis TaxID=149040 RepID=A0A194X298_MOLSC|nr:amidase-like protein [Mollisia scopiformis]KUJ14326.1 amidase-like protein [Mollisia scopiformis]